MQLGQPLVYHILLDSFIPVQKSDTWCMKQAPTKFARLKAVQLKKTSPFQN